MNYIEIFIDLKKKNQINQQIKSSSKKKEDNFNIYFNCIWQVINREIHMIY